MKCVPQNSCNAGHYTCDILTGEKICNYGFIDPTTSCITRNLSLQICPQSDGYYYYYNIILIIIYFSF